MVLPVLDLRGGIRGECSRDFAGETAFRVPGEARRNPSPRRCSGGIQSEIQAHSPVSIPDGGGLEDMVVGEFLGPTGIPAPGSALLVLSFLI